jgi:hypothetical protein
VDISVDNEHPASIFVANTEDAGVVILWEVCMRLQDYTVLQPRTL